MNPSFVAEALVKFQDKSVLVIGDVMLDRFIDGSVPRISPEAPVPVLEKSRETEMPGGAANVATNLASLGCNVCLIAVTGADTQGHRIAGLLRANMAIDFHQVIDADRPTTTKTRFRADGQQVLRFDEEVTDPISTPVRQQLMDTFSTALKQADLVIISDYAKGCVPPDIIAEITAATRAAGKMVVVDPKLADFKAYAGASLLTPNLSELHKTGALARDALEDIAKAASSLATIHGMDAILVTLSVRGMLLARADGSWHHAPAQAREVFDVSGAGDTVIAMLAAALASGVEMENAVKLANMAASVVVGKSGTAIASPGEIILMAGAPTPPTGWDQCASVCEGWHQSDEKIGFANGCFDLLHPGHIHLLRQAASRCDRLVVGLNSDDSVRRLKGDGRPAQSAERRAAALQALPYVDVVTVFDDDTPLELITAIQPDHIFKGGDYQTEDVIGREVVTARGGDVIIIPTLGSHSSTDLMKI